MREPNEEQDDRPLRVGSLFSGYGGLDLAVEGVFDARTTWFSEIDEPVSRAFAHHWPDAPNLGDITAIDWNTVEPVDILCGGFPCLKSSEVREWLGLMLRRGRSRAGGSVPAAGVADRCAGGEDRQRCVHEDDPREPAAGADRVRDAEACPGRGQ